MRKVGNSGPADSSWRPFSLNKTEALGQRRAHRSVMRAKLDRGQKFETNAVRPFDQAVDHEDRILLMGQQDSLLQHDFADLVMPHRQARFQAELSQVIRAVDRQGAAGPFLAAEADVPPVGQADLFGKMRQHHHASDRRGQGSDQQSVVTARNHAGHGSRGVSAHPVGNQPFARQERFQPSHLGFAPGHFSNKFSHAGVSWRVILPRLVHFSAIPMPCPSGIITRRSAPESSNSHRFPAAESQNLRSRDLRSTIATASNSLPAGPTAVRAPG